MPEFSVMKFVGEGFFFVVVFFKLLGCSGATI